MDLMEAVRARHSVRNYTDRPIEGEVLKALEEEIAACNREAGLHIQLVRDEPRAFDSTLAHYGSFTGVRNYLAMIGPKDGDLMEKCGYYGERIVLKAQMLGLNTCWVALTYKKIPDAYVVGPGEKLGIVIAIGYGTHEGKPRKSKSPESRVQCHRGFPGVVPEGRGGGAAGPHRRQSAEILPETVRRHRLPEKGTGSLRRL